MFRLHFNKSNGIYTVRCADRSIFGASERRAKLPLIGSTLRVAPRAYLIIPRGVFQKAIDKERPVLSVAETRFPFVRLLIERIKEVF